VDGKFFAVYIVMIYSSDRLRERIEIHRTLLLTWY